MLDDAPTRSFKTYTSNEIMEIFDKEFWVNLGSDFTMHSLRPYKNEIAEGKCLIINDATLLFASKSQRTKERIINGLSELIADEEYIYQDFSGENKFRLQGNVTVIMNIVPESFENYKDRLFGLTFAERILILHHASKLALSDDMHVETRIRQYEALKNGKATEIAKSIILAKVQGQNQVLKKYGLRRIDFFQIERIKNLPEDNLVKMRKSLLQIEGACSQRYFHEIFGLFPEDVRPERRMGYKAYDGVNNLFNLAYELLKWKVHIALIRAELEPYLGFVHSLKFGTPSLVCDFLELYRYLMEDFVLTYAGSLKPRGFKLKNDDFSNTRKGKRQYLNYKMQKEFTKRLNDFFLTKVEIPRIMRGERQEIETLINEEALLFAKYLRGERQTWTPRIAELK